MNKKTIDRLIGIADEKLRSSGNVIQDGKINSWYDGKTSALGVSISLLGLKPAVIMYYKDKDKNENKNKNKTYHILDIIFNMIKKDSPTMVPNIDNTTGFLEYLKNMTDPKTQKRMTNLVLECSIALKFVIRSYPQFEDKTKNN